MKLTILHDASGNILSVARIEPGGKKKDAPSFAVTASPAAGQSVLELDIEDDLEKRNLGDIHNQYRLDLKTKRLIQNKE
jgi:hypothetical protein